MTDSQKKAALLVASALIIAPVAVIRTRSALQGTHREINWEEKMKVQREAAAPSWYRDSNCCDRWDSPPALPALRLATIRMRAPIANNDHMIRNKRRFDPVHRALYLMGANVTVIEGVDDRVPGIESGYSEVTEAAYLLHAGKVPASYVRGNEPTFCTVLRTIPGSAAEDAGLRAGDLLWDIDHKSVFGTDTGDCQAFVNAATAVPVGSRATFSVIRNGSPLDVAIEHREPLYGYHYLRVPLLDSEKI